MEKVTRDRGSTVERVLGLIEEIGRAQGPTSLQSLADAIDAPRSTTHRLCASLEERGFLQRDLDGRRYLPGQALQRLATGFLSGSPLRLERHAVLENLSRDLGETCNLTFPDGTAMVYADRVETKWPLRLQFTVGSRVPLHCTASGKLYLSTLGKRRLRTLLNRLDLERKTPDTITGMERLADELEKIARAGYALDRGEFVAGMVAVAAPIMDAAGRFCGCIAVHGPDVRIDLDAPGLVPRVQQAARDMGEILARETGI